MDKNLRPKVSIVIPTHNMKNGEYFLSRCLNSIRRQKFQDYEIIVKKTGKGMARNCNVGIKEARGELIKILFMDDMFMDAHSLGDIVKAFTKETNWLVTGCEHDDGMKRFNTHYPVYSDDIETGNNTIGSPSVLTIRNEKPLFFDENLQWLIDCDYYKRLHDKYGAPTILNERNIVIGIGDHQQTHLLSDKIKKQEEIYVKNKFA